MRNSRKWVLYTIVAAAVLSGGCTQKTGSLTTGEIQTLPAVKGSVQKRAAFIGNVTSGQTSTLNWETNGVIGTINVKAGDKVKKGQILATLETEFLPADIINAEIPYITAVEDLEEVLESETPKTEAYKELKDKEAALEDAEKYKESLKYPHAVLGDILYWAGQVEDYRHLYDEAMEAYQETVILKNSGNKYERSIYDEKKQAMLDALSKYAEVYNNYLYYSGNATDNDKAQAAANIDVAKAEYENALKVFRTYSNYPREKDINTAQMNVDNARTTYDRRNIIASINGVVTQLNARSGDYVTQGSAALRLDNIEHLYIPIDISEIDILSIHDGMKAEITLDANPEKTYEGTITTISDYGSASDNRVTFQTMVEILKPDDKVKIGMTANVTLITDEINNVLIVPSNAVFTEEDLSYVGIFNGTGCNDIPVTVGLVSDTVTEITGGFLKEGDAVCVPSVDDRITEAMGLGQSDQYSRQTDMVPPPTGPNLLISPQN